MIQLDYSEVLWIPNSHYPFYTVSFFTLVLLVRGLILHLHISYSSMGIRRCSETGPQILAVGTSHQHMGEPSGRISAFNSILYDKHDSEVCAS